LVNASFDPKFTLIESIAGESAIIQEKISVTWLRTRFANPPVWIPEIGEDYRYLSTPASVLLPIVIRPDGLTLLLTQRTAHLTDHGGQISFPGGRAEADDTSAIETALREAEEEIGLNRRHVEVIGTLPDYFTGTGYRITPIVSLVQPPFDLCAAPFEVAEIFEVPFSFLMDGMNHQRRIAHFSGELAHRPFYAIPYEDFFIWGATAGILRNLFHFLRA
jgi:8-oxo-dGTP pyrophosphatase MutT (NUDIX family)